MKRKLENWNMFFLILLGILLGSILFRLGDLDDAPGLSFLGLIIAFMLIMRGIYHGQIIRRGYHMPIIFFVFGLCGLLLPIVLILDGEIEVISTSSILGNTLGIVCLGVSWIKVKKAKKQEIQKNASES